MTDQPLMSLSTLELLQHRLLDFRDHKRSPLSTTELGSYSSRNHGQGMEPFDSRDYQAGDDIRHIDWRATARRGKPVSKIYHKDSGRKIVLIIDRRRPMFFGTRKELKAATAARTAAIIAFSALAARVNISALVMNSDINIYPAIRTTNQLIPLLTDLTQGFDLTSNPDTNELSLSATLMHNLIESEASSALFIISDFHDMETDQHGPWQWIGQHLDTTAIYITDSGEKALPPVGLVRLHSDNNHGQAVIDTDDLAIRQQYACYNQQQDRQRAAFFANHNISYNTLCTDDDLLNRLQHLIY